MGETEPKPRTLTLDDLAAELGVSKKTVSRRYHDGSTPPKIKIGRAVRFLRSGIDLWFEYHCPNRVNFMKIKKEIQRQRRSKK